MKTPSGTFIVIVLAMLAIVSVIIFQACANEPVDGKTVSLKIGKDKDTFVEFVQPGGKEKFDAVLRRLPNEQYTIRYKKDDSTPVVENYSPPPTPDVSLKTDNVTTAALAKNEAPGDPHITQKVKSNKIADIQEVLKALKSPP
jgi:hypothetical protein